MKTVTVHELCNDGEAVSTGSSRREIDRTEREMLDTSTVILLGELDDPSVLPDECVISAVTLPSCRSDRTLRPRPASERPAKRICRVSLVLDLHDRPTDLGNLASP